MASKGSGIRLVAFDEQQSFGAPLRSAVVESVESFQTLSSCLSFIDEQAKEKKVVILVTTSTDENTLQAFQALRSVEAILILSPTVKDLEALPEKVIGIYPQIEPLLRALHEIFDIIDLQMNVSSFLLHRQEGGGDNFAFYFYILWKNHMRDQTSTKKSLVDHARRLFRSSPQIKGHIDEYEKSYRPTDVLSWLDRHRHAFPYHVMVNHALRTHDEQILSPARCFINDLSKQMKPSSGGLSQNQVYLGTQLPSVLIDQLEQYDITDAIAFQCFLPVTRSRAAALLAATRPCRRTDMVQVLFKIEMNNTPCAAQNDGLIIDAAVPFHVSCVTRSSGANGSHQLLAVVKLLAVDKMTRDQLFEQFIQRQRASGRSIDDLLARICSGISDEEALADELIARGEWARAAKLLAGISSPTTRVLNKLGCLFREHLNDLPGALNCHQRAMAKASDQEKDETWIYLGLVRHNMQEYEKAFQCYSQALQNLENEKNRDPVLIARSLVGMGNAKWALNKLDDALDYAERALAVREHEIKPRNDFDVAACLGNIGNIVHGQGDIHRALQCAKRAVDLLTTCGKGDPRLAAALNNLGAMHQSDGDLAKAREYFQRALESLPPGDHPHRKSTLTNIARLDLLEKSEK